MKPLSLTDIVDNYGILCDSDDNDNRIGIHLKSDCEYNKRERETD